MVQQISLDLGCRQFNDIDIGDGRAENNRTEATAAAAVAAAFNLTASILSLSFLKQNDAAF